MKEFNTLTRAEMQIMNILWDKGCGMTTHEIIDAYPEPHPAYSTIATFMKILTHKQYVTSYKRDGGWQDIRVFSSHNKGRIHTSCYEGSKEIVLWRQSSLAHFVLCERREYLG